MATTFPTTVDTFTDPISSDTLNSVTVPHHAQHTNLNDAVAAMQAVMFGLRLDLAASKVVGGATSHSIRNHADSADNLIITDAGNATLRGALSLASSVSKIVPGATSLSLRNNADSADNFILTNAGAGTLRGSLTLLGTGVTNAETLLLQDAKVVTDDANDIYHLRVNSSVTSNGSANPALSSNEYNGIVSTPTLSGTSGLGHFTAISGVSTITGTGTTQVHFGTTGRVYLSGAGNVVELIGLYGTVNMSGSGNVTSHATGLEIHNMNETQGSGTITNLFGINIPSILVGPAFTPPSSLSVNSVVGIQIGGAGGGVQNNIGLLLGSVPSVGTTNSMILGSLQYTDPAALTYGVSFIPSYALTANNAQAITTLNCQLLTTNTAYNYGVLTAAQFIANANGNGTHAQLTGAYSQAIVRNTGAATGANVTLAYGLRAIVMNLGNEATPAVIATSRTLSIESPAFGTTGTISTQYGGFVSNQGNAKVTGSSWGFFISAQSGATTRSYALESQGGEIKLNPTETIASSSGVVWNGIYVPPSTLTLSGSTAQTGGIGVHLVTLTGPTYNTGAVFAVKDAATLAILGPPVIGTGGGSITNPRALWVQAGIAEFDGLVQTTASTTGGAGLNIPHGAAPTSPVNGDVWTTSAGGMFVRINGTTKSVNLT